MAAVFVKGTLGSCLPYSVFGGGAAASGRPAANGMPPGSPAATRPYDGSFSDQKVSPSEMQGTFGARSGQPISSSADATKYQQSTPRQ